MPAPSYWPMPPPGALPPAAGPLAPPLAAGDFLAAWQLYLPQGRAWRAKDDPESVMYGLLAALADEQAGAYQRESNLFAEIDPASTYELIPEWQATLGLPDPCMPPDPPVALEQAQILARFTAFGGQSIPYFIDFAANLGATITITEMSNARVDETTCCENWDMPGPAPNGWFYDWDYVLLITQTEPYTYEWAVGDSSVDDPLTDYSQTPAASYEEFAVGDSTCCTPLAWWGNALLECELTRILPAQSLPIFAYAPAVPA